MGWIRRQADEHRCKKPEVARDPTVTPGDIWHCDDPGCGKTYTVKEDQRDGKWFAPDPRPHYPIYGKDD